MNDLSPDLLPILHFEMERGNSIERIDRPAGTQCPLAVILRLPMAVGEIERRLELPAHIESWESSDPHYPFEAGYRSNLSKHAIAGPMARRF